MKIHLMNSATNINTKKSVNLLNKETRYWRIKRVNLLITRVFRKFWFTKEHRLTKSWTKVSHYIKSTKKIEMETCSIWI